MVIWYIVGGIVAVLIVVWLLLVAFLWLVVKIAKGVG